MLHAMDRAAKSLHSPSSSSFAGLLASLTPAAKGDAYHAPAWNDGELGDDVVTLSYERALRNHARYRPDHDENLRFATAVDVADDGVKAARAVAIRDEAGAASKAAPARRPTPSCDLRNSSVTIRLSEAECARLRQRAMEAGMTVSAYLRSCVLEADALRAQVKEALAEMRTAAEMESEDMPVQKQRLGWLKRITKRS